MWGLQYDENFQNNPFFREILTNHSDLIVKVSEENWIICVPRLGVIEPEEITISTILDHILIPSDSNEHILYTLSKKQLSINQKEITTIDRFTTSVRILFEETFYNEKLKYTVLCLDKPLFISRTICDNHKVTVIETLHDAIEFMWSENLNHILIKIQKLCTSFIDQNRSLSVENLQSQKDLIGSLYSQCLQIVLKNRTVSDDCDNLKLAVETYMQSCLDKNLIRAVNTVTCFSDAHLNVIIRNSHDLQLKDLNISPKFCDNITNAKSELCKINNYVTILDKVNCLKLTLNQLNICLTSDDILQVLVFLITKLNINNWNSNLVYLTQFQFSSLDMTNENNFLITTLEAALEFIKTDEFNKINKSNQKPINPLFQTIITDNLEQLQQNLLKTKTNKKQSKLCHPLCNCDNCNQLVESSHDITMFNEKGQSLLTFATIFGRSDIIEFLLSIGGDVDSLDYFGRTSLHYACLKGYQDILLILVNCKTNFNIKDNDGNTPLHLACNNGHENCVKALLYTSKGLDIDSVNKCGDTALHLAVKWNYVGIVRLLLENNAIASIPNKKNQLAMHLAENYYTERLLRQFHNYLEYIPEPGLVPSPKNSVNQCHKEHGIKPCTVDQYKKIDLLLKAIENNDLPLTCFYLGFTNNSSTDYNFQSKCHPLCNCEKCDDWESHSQVILDKINVNTCNIDGFTPLHFAAKYGRTELLRILLDSRAVPNLKTYKTLQTPLHLACIYQQLLIVKELVKCGNCEIDPLDYKGNTPLFYACSKNNSKIVEVLLSNGANSDVVNYQGNSIIKEVQEKNLFGICNLLKDEREDNVFL